MNIKKMVVRAAMAGMGLSLLCRIPAMASGPLISGLEEDGEAGGPALPENLNEQDDTKTVVISQEALNDSLIEYGELEQLVRTGNSDAINAQNSLENSLEIYQSAYDALVSSGRDMLSKADELEEEDGDEALIAGYDQSAEILSASAKQMKRNINSLNSATGRSSLNNTVNSLVKSAQILMFSCKQMDYQASAAQKRVDARAAAYDLASTKKQAGLMTETELLEAEKSLLDARTSQQSIQDSADKLRRQLAVMVGRNGDEIEIGEIPAVTQEELELISPEEDKAKAVIADSDVKSIRKSSATGDSARKLRSQQLDEAKGAASVTMDELYQSVIQTQQLYEGASASFWAAEKEYGALQTKYGAGLISKSAWLSGEADWYSAIATFKSAEIEYRQAVSLYQWAIRGI